MPCRFSATLASLGPSGGGPAAEPGQLLGRTHLWVDGQPEATPPGEGAARRAPGPSASSCGPLRRGRGGGGANRPGPAPGPCSLRAGPRGSQSSARAAASSVASRASPEPGPSAAPAGARSPRLRRPAHGECRGLPPGRRSSARSPTTDTGAACPTPAPRSSPPRGCREVGRTSRRPRGDGGRSTLSEAGLGLGSCAPRSARAGPGGSGVRTAEGPRGQTSLPGGPRFARTTAPHRLPCCARRPSSHPERNPAGRPQVGRGPGPQRGFAGFPRRPSREEGAPSALSLPPDTNIGRTPCFSKPPPPRGLDGSKKKKKKTALTRLPNCPWTNHQ